MKFIASIFSIYILFLIAVPCVDAQSSCTQQQSTTHSENKTDNHQNKIDHCSPFCTCDCCVTQVIQQTNFIPQSFFVYAPKQLSEYRSTYSSSLYTSIWQPPRLG